MTAGSHDGGNRADNIAHLECGARVESNHYLPGCEVQGSLRVCRRGRILVTKGEHREGRVRCEEGRYSNEAQHRRQGHDRFTDSSEGHEKGQKNRNGKKSVQNEKEVKVNECQKPIVA